MTRLGRVPDEVIFNDPGNRAAINAINTRCTVKPGAAKSDNQFSYSSGSDQAQQHARQDPRNGGRVQGDSAW